MASEKIAPQNFRKALGALKDSTKVGMAKVNSENKDMDVATVKATNHDEVLPKEKHVLKIFHSVSSSSPRPDVVYCISGLARRISKTHSWIVALKTLIVIHRGLREVDETFQQELINYNDSKGHLFNLSHFRDDSSPTAWVCSSWVRCYALYIAESLECFRVLKYDIQKEYTKTRVLDSSDLLEQLPRLQQLLSRLLDCQPIPEVQNNFLIQHAFSKVAAESVRLYVAITDGVVNMVDKFFGMQRHDAVRALEIYKKSGKQAEKLFEFFEICRSLKFGRGQSYAKIDQPPESFLASMEEYVKDVPKPLLSMKSFPLCHQKDNGKFRTPRSGETSLDMTYEPDVVADALNLEDSSPGPITTPAGDQPRLSSSRERALESTPSSKLSVVTMGALGGGLDRLTLDTLYAAALATTNSNSNGTPTNEEHLMQQRQQHMSGSHGSTDSFGD